MAPLTLEGDSLGKKHQHFNKLVKEAIANKDFELSKINSDDSDIDNLLKIDIASNTRNVEYIIEVLKSNDMLYASRAIKKSRWLITDEEYAHVINPEYLHTQLFPNMNTKAVNKLMLHIRLHLKDESRVETFYEYLKETDEAYKWLEKCSIPFIENVIQNGLRISVSLFKRLCRRSAKFLRYYKNTRDERAAIQAILFLVKSHTTEVLSVIEEQKARPKLGKKQIEILMKTYPHRILDNLENYICHIKMPLLAKYIKQDEVITFLEKQFKKEYLVYFFREYNQLRHFVENMPDQERFEFVKKTFIETPNRPLHGEWRSYEEEKSAIHCTTESYRWYAFAPFSVAFTEIKKLIRAEHSPSERIALLSVLISCARRNPEHIKTLLYFFYEKHINEPFKFKIQFVNNLLKQISTYELDVETWNVLEQLFHSMQVYTESENCVQACLESITLYKVLHDEKVPEIVEKKFKFATFEKVQGKLNQEQSDKIFIYLLNFVSKRIQNKKITNESDFNETVDQVKNGFNLLKDWKKDITDYPFLLVQIQDLSKIKTENSWKTELSDLYNIKKSWRIHMFEESLTMNLSEESCLNALKHRPQLLTRHDKDIETLRTNDTVSLRRLLAKLRVYWPHSLAQHWIEIYLQNLDKPTEQKALIRGLFMLLPQNQVLDLAKKHKPKDFKINWGATEQTEINICKNIAQNLHLARPLLPLEAVLWYAKGDYLQYTVPSLNSILRTLNRVDSRKHLPKLLEAPVSLQKLGLRFAFDKLNFDELKPMLLKYWTSTKNSTIRSVLFTNTYTLICKTKNPAVLKELWELLNMFIDNLSAEEDKQIYKKLGNVKKVPVIIKAEFYMRSYGFLTSLPEKAKCEMYVNELLQYAPTIMYLLDEDFVAGKILMPVETKFFMVRSKFIEIFASYILFGKTEENQLHRFRRVLDPVMELAFKSWDSVREGQFYVKDNFNKLLSAIIKIFIKSVCLNEINVSAKLFVDIKHKMEEKLPVHENYEQYTCWKLITEYVKLLDEQKSLIQTKSNKSWTSNSIQNIWKEIHIELSPKFSPIIVKCLKEDTKQYFPTIYVLFIDAFKKMCQELSVQGYDFQRLTLEHMLIDNAFIPSFIVVCNSIPKYDIETYSKCEIRKIIASHPSKEVQMHYHHVFGYIPESKPE